MNRFLDKILDGLSVVLSGREKVNSRIASFLDKSNNGILVLSILFLIPFLIFSIFVFNSLDDWLWSLIPILVYGIILFFFALKLRMEKRSDLAKSRSKNELTGFNLDLNDLVLKKLFAYLIKYEYVDEELTTYDEFYNVMTLDFKEHDDVVHFKMNLAELKYLLEKIKKLKGGIMLTSFEKSNKIYNRGKLITQ